MISRIFAFLVWAACAAGVAYWGLRWLSKPLPLPPHSSVVSLTPAPKGDLSRLLVPAATVAQAAPGPSAQQSALAARIQLLGLMAGAGGSTRSSVALLAIDGKPARAFKVGQAVDGDQVVLAITRQGVDIGAPGSTAPVTLPAQTLPPAATGVLPPPASVGAPSMNVPQAALAVPPDMSTTQPSGPAVMPEAERRRAHLARQRATGMPL